MGDSLFGLMHALAKQDAIAFVSVRHESVAALMASAEAKLTGKLGVCVAHTGPGVANLMNGLGDAFLDGAPVLALTGQVPTAQIGTPYKQYVNQQEMVQAVAGYSQLIVHPSAVVKGLVQAMCESLSGNTVAHLTIPGNLFYITISPQLRTPPQAQASRIHEEALQKALDLMRSAKRPMVLAGVRARAYGDALCTLAKAWGCGLAMGYGAVGVVPDAVWYGPLWGMAGQPSPVGM